MKFFQICFAPVFVGVAFLSAQSSNALSAVGSSAPPRALGLNDILEILRGFATQYPFIRDSPDLIDDVLDFLKEHRNSPDQLERLLRKFLCERGHESFCCKTCTTTTTTEPPSTDDTSSEDTSSEDTSSEDTSSEDTSSEDTSSEDTSSEETSSEETSSEETSSEEPSSEEPSSEEPSSEETSSEETSSEETSSEETSSEETSSEETSSEEATTWEVPTEPCKPGTDEPCTITLTTSIDCFIAFLYKLMPILKPAEAQAVAFSLRGAVA